MRSLEEPGPTYVFAHFLLPHTPYVFLEDGTFAPKRATQASQVVYTNARTQGAPGAAAGAARGRAADHHPPGRRGALPQALCEGREHFDWTTASDDELVEKYGILDALYLPGPEGQPPPAQRSPVNTYGEDLPPLLRGRLRDAAGPQLHVAQGPPVRLLRDHRQARPAARRGRPSLSAVRVSRAAGNGRACASVPSMRYGGEQVEARREGRAEALLV